MTHIFSIYRLLFFFQFQIAAGIHKTAFFKQQQQQQQNAVFEINYLIRSGHRNFRKHSYLNITHTNKNNFLLDKSRNNNGCCLMTVNNIRLQYNGLLYDYDTLYICYI